MCSCLNGTCSASRRGSVNRGPAALAHGNRGHRPRHAIADELRMEVIGLATSLYRDYNHSHLQEELVERHDLNLSRRSVTRILTAAVPAADASPARTPQRQQALAPLRGTNTAQACPQPRAHRLRVVRWVSAMEVHSQRRGKGYSLRTGGCSRRSWGWVTPTAWPERFLLAKRFVRQKK